MLNGFGDVDGPRCGVLAAGQTRGPREAYYARTWKAAHRHRGHAQIAPLPVGRVDILVNNAGILRDRVVFAMSRPR